MAVISESNPTANPMCSAGNILDFKFCTNATSTFCPTEEDSRQKKYTKIKDEIKNDKMEEMEKKEKKKSMCCNSQSYIRLD